MKTLTFFAPNLSGGGAERAAVNLARCWSERGVTVHFVLLEREGAYLDQVPDTVKIFDFGGRKLLKSAQCLFNYLENERPDLLISILNEPSIFVLLLRAFAKIVKPNSFTASIPIVVNVQNNVSTEAKFARNFKTWTMPLLARLFFPWAESVVPVSQGVGDDLIHLGIPASKIQVIHNPVVTPGLLQQAQKTVAHPWFAPGQPPVIVAVGRLEAQKDYLTLFQAFAIARKTRFMRLVILGEGDLRKELEARVEAMGLSGDVILPGFASNPFSYVAASSLFVLSSIFEGLPTVLIEAMAVGTPVVSTDCPSGPHEILSGGHYGPLVKMRSPEALAAAMLARLDMPRNSEFLKQRANKYSLEASVNAYSKLCNLETRIDSERLVQSV